MYKQRFSCLGVFLVLAFFLCSLNLSAQTASKLITYKCKNAELSKAFNEIERLSGYYHIQFSYNNVDGVKSTVDVSNATVPTVVKLLVSGKGLESTVKGQFIYITKTKANAKHKTVSGYVLDLHNTPLRGAVVRNLTSGRSAVTDANGQFAIGYGSVTDDMVVTYLGKKDVSFRPRDGKTQSIYMDDDDLSLNDVVVTGYQTLKKQNVTGAYGFVNEKKLTEQMHKDLTSSLEGQIAGLRMEVNTYTGEMSPILRGVGTFSNDVGTQPLIVIDNIPTEMSLSDINPYNVESVTVLKDAAAASIYGALAANGVIVIKTKEGKDNGVKVNVNADWYVTSKPNFESLDLASTGDIIEYQTSVYQRQAESAGSGANWLSGFKSNYYYPLYQLLLDKDNGKITEGDFNATLQKWRSNDYYEEFRKNAWRQAFTQTYNVSISQRTSKANHFASVNFSADKPRQINDKSNSFKLYYKSGYNLTSWLHANVGVDTRLGHSTSYSSYDYNLQQRYERILSEDGTCYTSPYVNVGGYAGSAYNGSVVGSYEGKSGYESFGFNVLDALGQGAERARNVALRPFASIEASFLKAFKWSALYQYEWGETKRERYDAPGDYIMRMTHNAMIDETGKSWLPDGGRYRQVVANTNRYTFRTQLDFNKTFARDHSVTAMMGMEFRQNKSPKVVDQLLYGYNPQTLTSERMNWEDYYTGVGTSQLSGSAITLGGPLTTLQETRHRYASLYGSASYTYQYRYNIAGSIRWDEADLFGLDTRNQHTPLWSVGAGWTVSEEPFMQQTKSWLDYLKLRMTYGVNGNVDQTSTTYFVVSKKNNSNPVPTTYLNYTDDDLPNPHLRWEKTATYNVGLDFRLWNSVLSGTVDYYNRHASDLLVRRYMDSTLGAKSRVVNNGQMRNRGVEISLTGNVIRNNDWTFSATLTYAHNSNKMLKVDHSDTDNASSFILSPANYFIEGTSYNTLWAYRIRGIENGYPIAVDKDGNDLVTFKEDGTIDKITSPSQLKGTDDLVNMGTLTPTYNGSLSLNLRYKQFELNAMFICSGGNKLRMSTVSLSDAIGSETLRGIADRWSSSNPAGVRMYIDMPALVQGHATTFDEWYQYGDINVKSADYVKLRSINLAYCLPVNACRMLGLGATRFTLQVNNLFCISKAGRHIDPESYGLNNGTRGMTVPRTLSLGVSTTF